MDGAALSHRDFTLRKDAPIFRDLPGFPSIPFRQMGRAGRFDPLLLEFEDDDVWQERLISGVELRSWDEIQIVCQAQGKDAACVDAIRLKPQPRQ